MKITLLLFALLFLSRHAVSQSYIDQRAKDGNNFVYINFIMNCHNFAKPDEAYTTLLKLCRIFRKYNAKADFYFLEPMVTRLKQLHPDIIDTLLSSNISISYHHRAPHPVYMNTTISRNIAALPWDSAMYFINKFESQHLNLVTGDFNPSLSGGYSYVKNIFGYSPVTIACIGIKTGFIIERESMYACKLQGAKSVMTYHEAGADANYPFMWYFGMIERPADYSVTRWIAGSQTSDRFWWEMIETPDEQYYSPANYFQQQIASRDSSKLTIVNAIMHETDFHYTNIPWKPYYYFDSLNTQERQPPFDTTRTASWVRIRSEDYENKIWNKYDSLVKFASSRQGVKIVTMNDITNMFPDDRTRAISKQQISAIAASIISTPVANFPKKFFVLPNQEFFSLSDAFYSINYSLNYYRQNNSLPQSFALKDLIGPVDTSTSNLVSTSQFSWTDISTGAKEQDSLINYFSSLNPMSGRLPNKILLSGSRYVNPFEYLYLIAREYKQIDSLGSAANITPVKITYSGKPQQVDGNEWTRKPARRINTASGINTEIYEIPSEIYLHQNFPNPFNPVTKISFEVPKQTFVTIKVFDITGREIVSLVNDMVTRGYHAIDFNAAAFASGVYFYRIETAGFSDTRRMVLIK